MKIWLITDTHFGHGRMVDFCGRPPDFAEQILSHLKRNVTKDSLLIHLGDVCIGNDSQWHEKLSDAIPETPKILIRGNHDRKSNFWYMSNGWKFVAETVSDTLFGMKVLLSHFPIEWNGYDINVHGHFHNSDHRRHEPQFVAIKNDKHRLLAIEHTGLKPVLMEKFIKTPPIPRGEDSPAKTKEL